MGWNELLFKTMIFLLSFYLKEGSKIKGIIFEQGGNVFYALINNQTTSKLTIVYKLLQL